MTKEAEIILSFWIAAELMLLPWVRKKSITDSTKVHVRLFVMRIVYYHTACLWNFVNVIMNDKFLNLFLFILCIYFFNIVCQCTVSGKRIWSDAQRAKHHRKHICPQRKHTWPVLSLHSAGEVLCKKKKKRKRAQVLHYFSRISWQSLASNYHKLFCIFAF